MPELAITQDNGKLAAADPLLRPVRDRIREGREHRKQFELIWISNQAFASGQVWNVVDPNTRTLRKIQDMDPAYRGRELYTAEIIGEYRTTALGELGSDDDRPELLLQRDDRVSEQYQAQANRALGHGWDHEWRGADALAEADQYCVDLGTSAIQCRFNPTVGEVKADNVPYFQGRPVLATEKATELLGNGPNPRVQMKAIREGRIEWIPRSPWNLIVPPGVTHERYFPWEAIIEAAYLPDVKDRYPLAADLKEDQDIASSMGRETGSGSPVTYATGEGRETRLRDHVWLVTYFERPTGKYQSGRTIVFAGNDLRPLEVRDGSDGEPGLPYKRCDGTYGSGISYFHWWRVTGRFWGRALIEPLKDPARIISKRRTQMDEIIDKGMPYVLVPKGSEARNRRGIPFEVITVDYQGQTGAPIPVQGTQPGEWMNRDVQEMRDDAQHASGIRAPSMGENPSSVTTYSQLALLHEADHTKRLPTMRDRKQGIYRLVEDSVYDIRTYWGRDKQIMLAGDGGSLDAEVFDATLIPPFYILVEAKGEAKPRTQAAKLKLIDDIAQYSLNSQQPVPVSWYKRSLEAGEPLDLPENPADDQADKAELENHLLLIGRDVPVAYYDPPLKHIPIHRSAQIRAELEGDMEAWQRIEKHVQEHLAVAQQNTQQAPPELPGAPGVPPAGPQPGPGPAPAPAGLPSEPITQPPTAAATEPSPPGP